MNIERVPASHGWLWIKLGYRLITRSPLLAIVLAAIAAAGIFLAMKLPAVGPMLAIILLPVLLVGYMRACEAMEHSDEVELVHLFAGFQKRTAALIALGGLLLIGLVICSLVSSMIGGEMFANLLNDFQSSDDTSAMISAIQAGGPDVALSLLVGFLLILLLMLAFQYAPMLVFFNGLAPFAALKASFFGSVRNLIPLTVYSLIMQIVGMLASVIPYDLGLIVLIPLGLTSMYTSFRDIYSPINSPGVNADSGNTES
jgi:uncharacterized membrane protein